MGSGFKMRPVYISAAAISSVAVVRTHNLTIERRTLYHWAIAALRHLIYHSSSAGSMPVCINREHRCICRSMSLQWGSNHECWGRNWTRRPADLVVLTMLELKRNLPNVQKDCCCAVNDEWMRLNCKTRPAYVFLTGEVFVTFRRSLAALKFGEEGSFSDARRPCSKARLLESGGSFGRITWLCGGLYLLRLLGSDFFFNGFGRICAKIFDFQSFFSPLVVI